MIPHHSGGGSISNPVRRGFIHCLHCQTWRRPDYHLSTSIQILYHYFHYSGRNYSHLCDCPPYMVVVTSSSYEISVNKETSMLSKSIKIQYGVALCRFPSRSAVKLTFTQFLLKTIVHTCLLTGVLTLVYPSAIIVMHKRPNYRCMFLHVHLQVWAIISRKKLSERELGRRFPNIAERIQTV
jgi:hypothetical protein